MDVICYERKKLYALDALRKLARKKFTSTVCLALTIGRYVLSLLVE